MLLQFILHKKDIWDNNCPKRPNQWANFLFRLWGPLPLGTQSMDNSRFSLLFCIWAITFTNINVIVIKYYQSAYCLQFIFSLICENVFFIRKTSKMNKIGLVTSLYYYSPKLLLHCFNIFGLNFQLTLWMNQDYFRATGQPPLNLFDWSPRYLKGEFLNIPYQKKSFLTIVIYTNFCW